jgi:hypothetical protein
MKDNVLIYSQQYEAVKELPDADFGKVFRSVFEYAFNGKADNVSPDIKIAFSFMKNQIDRDQKRYEDKCEANRENVKKRWDTKRTTVYNRIRRDTKHTDTENDIKENISKDIQKKDELSISDISGSEDYIQFRKWMKDNAPYCDNPKHYTSRITEKQLHKLKEKYTGKQISDKILELENSKKCRGNYTNLYFTINKWLKREDNGQ